MDIYKGQQQPSLTGPDRLGRTYAGNKEPTGFCENNDRFVGTDDNLSRFITHYDTR